jgi:hypothetical protein
MSGFRYRCPLGKLQPQTPDVEAIKREGWREQGILVVSTEDTRLDWMEKQLLRQIAERLYGRQEVSHG